ncbi:MAG: sugar ABC transporter ATP-binding protein [Nitriliruptoraceae bacterium]
MTAQVPGSAGSSPPETSSAPGRQPLLTVSGVSKAFPGVQALDDVDLDLHAGEIHALMGENGAGKSTLMKIIAGVQRPDTGTLHLAGEQLELHRPSDALRHGIVTVFQELTVLDNLDVGRNLLLGNEPTRGSFIDWSALYREAARSLTDFGVDLDVRTPLEQLTVGLKQLVEIVRAARLEPRVLILDEPTSALGRREEELLFAMVRRLRERGVGIVYISHRMEEVFHLSDRITVLRDGRHIRTDTTRTLDRDELIRSMVGREVVDDRLGGEPDPARPVRLVVRGLARPPRVLDIDLELRAGEVVGMAGLVGSGRTELAETLYGVARPERGSIHLDGRSLELGSPAEALGVGIGYVPEDRKQYGLVLGMTVDENLTLPSLRRFTQLGLLRWSRLRAAAGGWIDQLRIKVSSGRQRALTLSGGNQQKVVIAKVLSREPEVLILDEPTRGIDVGSKRELHELIRRIASSGVAVLMISSELPEILAVSDRIVVLRAGRVAGELPAATATEEAVLSLAFDGQVSA